MKSRFIRRVHGTLLLLTGISAFGAEEGAFLPVGLVGPSLHQSIQINPAALAGMQATRLSGFFGPDILSKGSTSYEGSFTHSNDKWGAGVDVVSQNGETLYGAFGFKAGETGIGFNIDYPFASGSSIGFDLGVRFGSGKGMSYGVVLYNLTASPSLGLGLGYLEMEKLTLEANLNTPTFATLTQTGSTYSLSVGGSLYEGVFGISFFGSYDYILGNTQSNLLRSTFSLMINPTNFPSFAMHFASNAFTSFELTFEF